MVVDGRLDTLVPWDGVSGEFGVGQHRSDWAFHPDLDDFFGQSIVEVFTTADGRIEIMQEVFGRDSVFDESLRAEGLSFDFGKREFLLDRCPMNLTFVANTSSSVAQLKMRDIFFTFHVFWKDDAATASAGSSPSDANLKIGYAVRAAAADETTVLVKINA